jgi:HEAT repeat protein
MRKFSLIAALLIFALATGIGSVMARDVDVSLKDLKDQDPAVRSRAAYDLGCG